MPRKEQTKVKEVRDSSMQGRFGSISQDAIVAARTAR